MKTVVVTALYDIGRSQQKSGGDGRTWATYLTWFQKTLQLNVPMVLFVDKETRGFVATHRPKQYDTHVIAAPLTAAPAYKYLPQITSIINNQAWRKTLQNPQLIENRLPLYSVVLYSKFGWLLKAAEILKAAGADLETLVLLWLDAGASRFFGTVDFSVAWPHSSWYDALLADGRVIVQTRRTIAKLTSRIGGESIDTLMVEPKCHFVAGVFGGKFSAVRSLCQTVISEVLEREMLGKGRLNNEQYALGVAYKLHGTKFLRPIGSAKAAWMPDMLPLVQWMARPTTSEFQNVNLYLSHPCQYYFSVATVVNEPVPEEKVRAWIDHHLKLGANHIYLILLRGAKSVTRLRLPRRSVTLIPTDEPKSWRQARVFRFKAVAKPKYLYRKHLKPLLHQTQWLVPLPFGDFLFAPKGSDIVSVLRSHEHCAQIRVGTKRRLGILQTQHYVRFRTGLHEVDGRTVDCQFLDVAANPPSST